MPCTRRTHAGWEPRAPTAPRLAKGAGNRNRRRASAGSRSSRTEPGASKSDCNASSGRLTAPAARSPLGVGAPSCIDGERDRRIRRHRIESSLPGRRHGLWAPGTRRGGMKPLCRGGGSPRSRRTVSSMSRIGRSPGSRSSMAIVSQEPPRAPALGQLPDGHDRVSRAPITAYGVSPPCGSPPDKL